MGPDSMRCTARASYSAGMTRELPDGESLLIRTDFSDDARWSDTVEAATQPTDEGFVAGLTVVDDAEFDRLTLGELAVIIGSPPPYYVFLADAATITDPEHAILAVDTADGSSGYPSFRVHPSQMASVENNLSLANMDFEDFSSAAGADGVFRGFEPPATTRTPSKAALLDAIEQSSLSPEAIEVYRASLEQWPRPEVDGNYIPDVAVGQAELVGQQQRNEYRYNSWVIGLDESIAALAGGGAAIGFAIVAASIRDRVGGYCSAWVDPVSLAPVAILATGHPPRRTRT